MVARRARPAKRSLSGKRLSAAVQRTANEKRPPSCRGTPPSGFIEPCPLALARTVPDGAVVHGTRGRSPASFRQAAIPLHQNGGRNLCPHRPQRSLHWISRAGCGRSRRYRAGDGPQHRPAAGKPLDRNGVISGSDNADGADGRAPTFSGAAAADGRDLRHTFAGSPEMQRLRPDKAIALPARTRPPVLGWLSCTNTANSEKNPDAPRSASCDTEVCYILLKVGEHAGAVCGRF